jgi:tetratricopeptide (TPR) repeat protein
VTRLLALLLLAILVLAPVTVAQGRGARNAAATDLLNKALRLQESPPPGMTQDRALDEAYQIMGKAFQADARLWQALLYRGINRCDKMLLANQKLRARLLALRAEGESDAETARIEGLANDFISDVILRDAHQNFAHMERTMKRLGEPSDDTVLFANAMMKFSHGEYLKAHAGAPGAIDDLKKLVQRKFMIEFCAERIALAYMDLGATEFEERRYEEAQDLWDKGLRWAHNEKIRRFILTNKAGAYEMDDEYGLAEELLRKQLRSEIDRPAHWKNLGLVLGYQNRLRPALFAYRQSRNLCGEYGRRSPIARLHGNSWLKAAMIHGKLLEAEGDLRTAWRLFLEYRAMFGDDYNFCFNFGEFVFHMGQYNLAWEYLSRAKDLQPFCPHASVLLVRVAQRVTLGTPEEQRARRELAKEELEASRERFSSRNESPQMKRICGGLQDLGDGDLRRANPAPMTPDPLVGYRIDSPPPPWLVKRAAQRDPFMPFEISPSEFLAKTSEDAEASAVRAQAESEEPQKANWKWLALGAGGLAVALGAIALFRRRAA